MLRTDIQSALERTAPNAPTPPQIKEIETDIEQNA